LDQRRGLSLAGAVLCAVIVLGGIALLGAAGRCTAEAALLVFSLGSLTYGLLILTRSRDFRRPSVATLMWSWRHSWTSGRWLVVATLCYWLSTLGLIPFAVLLIGPAAGGSIRVVQALTNPLAQFGVLTSSVILPLAAGRLRDGDRSALLRVALPPVVFVSLVGLVYTAALGTFGLPLITLLFPGKAPLVTRTILVLGTLAAAMDLVETLVTLPQLARNRTMPASMARVAAATVLFATFSAFGWRIGLAGLMIAMVFAYLAQLGVATLGLIREYASLPVRAGPRVGT
jgi:hypothetical protein